MKSSDFWHSAMNVRRCMNSLWNLPSLSLQSCFQRCTLALKVTSLLYMCVWRFWWLPKSFKLVYFKKIHGIWGEQFFSDTPTWINMSAVGQLPGCFLNINIHLARFSKCFSWIFSTIIKNDRSLHGYFENVFIFHSKSSLKVWWRSSPEMELMNAGI